MYASVQAIRESTGMLKRVENETPSGTANGVNTEFISKRRPFVDGDGDTNVTDSDVNFYVNDAVAEIESIDETSGSVTLVDAPPNGAKLRIDYYFSPLTTDYVNGKAQEADSWIDTKLKGKVTLPFKGGTPGIIETVAELYAAGLILLKDYGARADTELTSKDGKLKLDQARKLLEDYIAGVEQEAKDAAAGAGSNRVNMVTDNDVFRRRRYDTECDPDDFFMRRDC